jgi:hypothetical protein
MKHAAECGLFGLCKDAVLIQEDMDKLAVKAKRGGLKKCARFISIQSFLRVLKDEIHRLYALSGDSVAGKKINQS